MEQQLLVTIASMSLLVALATGAALWSALYRERQRSAARVTLLKAATTRASVPAPPRELTSTHEATGSTRDGMFASAGTTSPSGRRMAAAVVVAFCAVVAVLLALRPQGSPAAATADGPGPAAAPLELLALHHTPHENGLTISGIARNPSVGLPMTDVVVVTSVRGTDGREIGSGHAALDRAVLEPGGAAPFVINVAVGDAVGRYRVGFRGADGAVLAHVDRRSDVSSRSHGTIGGRPWVP